MASRTPPSEVLAAWLGRQRWFAAKARRIAAAVVEDRIDLGPGELAIVAVTLDDGSADRYAVPLGPGDRVTDALDDPAFGRALLDLVARAADAPGASGTLRGRRTQAFPRNLEPDLDVRRVGGEQSNTSLVFGRALIMKHFRRLADGVNPEAEVTRFLTERAGFTHAPRLTGQLDYVREGSATTVAVVQELVADGRDGWEWMLAALAALHARARGEPAAGAVRALAADTLRALRRLGEVTAALHVALASDPTDPAFAPEPITAADLEAWSEDVRRQLAAARAVPGGGDVPGEPPGVRAGLDGLLGRVKIRHHGDLHLGQTLYREAAGDWVLIDFEGEPLRPLAERRRKHAALRDVAGVLRSIDYAAALGGAGAGGDAAVRWAEAWRDEASREFTEGYRRAAGRAPFAPEAEDAFSAAVAVFELEKAAYEVVYEANHRPDWIAIPRRGLLRACARLGRAAAAGAA